VLCFCPIFRLCDINIYLVFSGFTSRPTSLLASNSAFLGKPEGKRQLGIQRRRWKYGIKMDLREIDWGGVEWIHLDQDRDRWRAVVSAVMNLRVLAPQSLLKDFELCEMI
jgi:hypothetical protein